jgi:hypothetical protein
MTIITLAIMSRKRGTFSLYRRVWLGNHGNSTYEVRIFRQTRRLDDWSLFKNASNAAKSMLKEAEKSYARNQLQNCEGKPGAIWKVINQYLPSRESPDHIFSLNWQNNLRHHSIGRII